MKNQDLAKDYIIRAKGRLKALDTLFSEKLWADVVRESQEVVELALKALIRSAQIEAPRVHDVSSILEANSTIFSSAVQKVLPDLVDISQELRRDREIAFYGSEDITPHEFYKEKHAVKAISQAKRVVGICEKEVI